MPGISLYLHEELHDLGSPTTCDMLSKQFGPSSSTRESKQCLCSLEMQHAILDSEAIAIESHTEL